VTTLPRAIKKPGKRAGTGATDALSRCPLENLHRSRDVAGGGCVIKKNGLHGLTAMQAILVLAVMLLASGCVKQVPEGDSWISLSLTYQDKNAGTYWPSSASVSESGTILIAFTGYTGEVFIGRFQTDDILASFALGLRVIKGKLQPMKPPDVGPGETVHHLYPTVTCSGRRSFFVLNQSWAAEIFDPWEIRWLQIDLKEVPEVEYLHSLVPDNETSAFYAVGRTSDSPVLLTGHLADDSKVRFELMAGGFLKASRRANGKVTTCGDQVLVLISETIATGSSIPKEMYKPGPVSLFVFNKIGELEDTIAIDYSGTTLGDVLCNSLQQIGQRLFVKVGSRIWLYDGSTMAKVLEDDRLQGLPICITKKGILVVEQSSSAYWGDIDALFRLDK